jgi:hypothetical protein
MKIVEAREGAYPYYVELKQMVRAGDDEVLQRLATTPEVTASTSGLSFVTVAREGEEYELEHVYPNKGVVAYRGMRTVPKGYVYLRIAGESMHSNLRPLFDAFNKYESQRLFSKRGHRLGRRKGLSAIVAG